MANGNLKKTLRKVVEGEHLAANALAVAASKAKELDLQQLFTELSTKHETNAVNAGTKLKELGGKYPTPGLRDTLKKGWESVATSRTALDAIKLLQKKEREALVDYKGILKNTKDEGLVNMMARHLADTVDNVTKLDQKVTELQKKKKGGKFLGLPRLVWLAALGTGAAVFVIRRRSSAPENPSTPTNSTGTPAGDSNKS
ncbi:MAG: ferritin-like domain-containing protein [Chloroflexi bacterium]|uniref:Ferritin-like domain-containing protein n=1 Tax=Candidatus Chlorohelix allophototropha TaxID=3003348 RepID=A0A8T7M5W2_9CHLR|nr:ferritin-like domain-containing protein [Chloroflexota bacterium]WJW69365.1 ferritin-like domain-containing protein [Chloroflexota bacterium L227-S17]